MNVFPSLEDTIGQAQRLGWDALIPPVRTDAEAEADEAAAQRTAAKETERESVARRIAQLYARDDDFRALLAMLARDTLHRPLLLSPLNLPIDQAYAYGQYREGQNATVYMIFKLIGEGRKEKVEPRGEAT